MSISDVCPPRTTKSISTRLLCAATHTEVHTRRTNVPKTTDPPRLNHSSSLRRAELEPKQEWLAQAVMYVESHVDAQKNVGPDESSDEGDG